MDLLSGLRKGDSSRGGRAEFSWDAVKEDKDRENYLGHSLMAPVGRWQRGKDLTWYSKAGSGDADAEEKRKEEIRRIKEAEQDALAAALGYPVHMRRESLGQKDVENAIKDTRDDDDEEGKGVGFGKSGDAALERKERPRGDKPMRDRERSERPREERHREERHREERVRERRDRDRGDRGDGRERRHRTRSRSRDGEDRRHRHRSRSPRREHRHRDKERSRDEDKGRDRHRHRRDDRRRSRSRSRSPRRDNDRTRDRDSRR
ncbi:kinase phosphorylation protein-domain-containing protein [Pyronema omphalodes]|nr:kinase phosphorylation protein-domain-containing protein [Pyronema omphalodes]